MELKQRYADRKQKDNYDFDNKILNTVFEKLYTEGYKLVSTSSISDGSREVIYLLVKE